MMAFKAGGGLIIGGKKKGVAIARTWGKDPGMGCLSPCWCKTMIVKGEFVSQKPPGRTDLQTGGKST